MTNTTARQLRAAYRAAQDALYAIPGARDAAEEAHLTAEYVRLLAEYRTLDARFA